MIDFEKYDSKFIKEKREDLEFLQSIDYSGLNSKVEQALLSKSAQKMLDARQCISRSEDRILKNRENPPKIEYLDKEIQDHVSRYVAVKASLERGIAEFADEKKAAFHKEYQSKTQDIPQLRETSEEYSLIQNIVQNPDQAIIAYSGFSRELHATERKIDDAINEYKEAKDCGQGKKVREKIEGCKIELANIRNKAPARFLRGIHAAYNYRSENLEKLDTELERFEKEKFIDRKNSAKEELWLAGSLIERLGNASEGNAYEILAEFARQKFSDFTQFEKTLYLGDIAQDHAGFIKELKSLAKKRAQKCQAGEAQNLGAAVNEALNTKQPDELKSRRDIIQNSYSEKANLLCAISGDDSLKKSLESGKSSIDNRIKDVQDQTELERKHELSKKKIESDERLGREEIGRKYDFEKQGEEFRKKEETFERRLQEIEREGASYASGLKKEKEDNKAKEKTIDALMENIGKTLQVGKESMDDLGKELSAGLYKKFCDQLERGLKRVGEYMEKYEHNDTVLAGKINAFQSDLNAIRNELGEIRKERGQMQAGINESFLLEKISQMITDGLERIVITIPKEEAPKQPYCDIEQMREMNRLREENVSLKARQNKNEEEYSILFSIESLSWPEEMDLISVKRKLDGDGEYRYNGMINRVLAIKEDFVHAKASDSIFTHEWVKKLRSIIKEDLDCGLIAHYVSCGGYAREQFYEVLGAIDGFIKRSEPLVHTKLASLSAVN